MQRLTPEAFPAAAHLGCQRQCGEVAVIPISGGVAEESDGDADADMNLLQVPEGDGVGWVGVRKCVA